MTMNGKSSECCDWIGHEELKNRIEAAASDRYFKHVIQWNLEALVGFCAVHVSGGNGRDEGIQDGKGHRQGWLIEIVAHAGYYFKVQYLGYLPEERASFGLSPSIWVHFLELETVPDLEVLEEKLTAPIELPTQEWKDAFTERTKEMLLKLKSFPSVSDLKIVSQWKPGDMVEARDKRLINYYRVGRIEREFGGRLQISFYTTAKKALLDAYYCDPRWEHLHSVGWAKESGARLLVQTKKAARAKTVTNSGIRSEDADSIIGQVFEMISPMGGSVFVVGQVLEALNNGYLKCKIISCINEEDLKIDCKGQNEFLYTINSPHIFPCGTVQSFGQLLLPPADNEASIFDWSTYLTVSGKSPLKFPDREEKSNEESFQAGMILECGDMLNPSYIAPAIVVETMAHILMKVSFFGWGQEFDQWRPMNDTNVYPAGWCRLNGYPLSAPGKTAEPELQRASWAAQKASQCQPAIDLVGVDPGRDVPNQGPFDGENVPLENRGVVQLPSLMQKISRKRENNSKVSEAVLKKPLMEEVNQNKREEVDGFEKHEAHEHEIRSKTTHTLVEEAVADNPGDSRQDGGTQLVSDTKADFGRMDESGMVIDESNQQDSCVKQGHESAIGENLNFNSDIFTDLSDLASASEVMIKPEELQLFSERSVEQHIPDTKSHAGEFVEMAFPCSDFTSIHFDQETIHARDLAEQPNLSIKAGTEKSREDTAKISDIPNNLIEIYADPLMEDTKTVEGMMENSTVLAVQNDSTTHDTNVEAVGCGNVVVLDLEIPKIQLYEHFSKDEGYKEKEGLQSETAEGDGDDVISLFAGSSLNSSRSVSMEREVALKPSLAITRLPRGEARHFEPSIRYNRVESHAGRRSFSDSFNKVRQWFKMIQ